MDLRMRFALGFLVLFFGGGGGCWDVCFLWIPFLLPLPPPPPSPSHCISFSSLFSSHTLAWGKSVFSKKGHIFESLAVNLLNFQVNGLVLIQSRALEVPRAMKANPCCEVPVTADSPPGWGLSHFATCPSGLPFNKQTLKSQVLVCRPCVSFVSTLFT